MKELFMKMLHIATLIFTILPLYGSDFTTSKKEDLDEMLHYFQSANPERSKDDLGAELNTTLPNNIYQHESFDELVTRLGSSDQRIQDIYDAFNILKLKMHLPKDIELYFLKAFHKNADLEIEEEALYNAYERRLYLSNNFFRAIPSSQLCTLIHECTHIQQHQRSGLKKHVYFSDSFAKEQEADINAIESIKCPVCIQLIEDDWLDVTSAGTYRPDHGYLSRTEIQKYKLEKKDSNTCKAHAAHTAEAQKLRTLVAKKSQSAKLTLWQRMFGNNKIKNTNMESEKTERLDLDRDCPKIEARLSSVDFKK